MSSHSHTRPMNRRMSIEQQAVLIAEAKLHANALREQAIDAALSALRQQLTRSFGQLRQALWPQSRTPRKEASHTISVVTRRVQNRPRGPLRLMDP